MPFNRLGTTKSDRQIANTSYGFTLLETIIVLAITALLLTLSLPRYFEHLQSSKEIVLRENLRITRDAIQKFFGDQGRYPETLDELVEKRYLNRVPVDPITENSGTWILLLPPSGYSGQVYDLRSGASGNTLSGTSFSVY